MQSIEIDGATRVIGESQGYAGLAVRDERVDCAVNGPGTPVMTTAWRPTVVEIEAIQAGATLYLHLLGTRHPPVLLTVGLPPAAA